MSFFYECAASLHVAYFILLHLLCTTSVLHKVAISLDRFVAVVFPLRHRNFIEVLGELNVMLIVSWSIPILAPALKYIVPPALFPGSFIKFLRMTTFAVSYFFICFFYFLSNSFGETDFPNGGACCLHTGGRNGYVHCLLDSSDNCNGFFIGKPLVKRNIHLLIWLRTLALPNSAMNFLIYSAKIWEFKEAFVSIIRKMSTDVPLVECSTFAKVLKNFSKFELEISHHPMVQVEGIYA